MTALCHMAEIRSVSIKIEASRSVSLDLTGDMMETKLYSAVGNTLGTVKELLLRRWNEGSLPSDAGLYERLEFIPNPIYVATHGDYVKANVYATIEVSQRRYHGVFTPEQVAFLEGTAESPVDMPDIRVEWQEVLAADADPDAQAVFTSVVQY